MALLFPASISNSGCTEWSICVWQVLWPAPAECRDSQLSDKMEGVPGQVRQSGGQDIPTYILGNCMAAGGRCGGRKGMGPLGLWLTLYVFMYLHCTSSDRPSWNYLICSSHCCSLLGLDVASGPTQKSDDIIEWNEFHSGMLSAVHSETCMQYFYFKDLLASRIAYGLPYSHIKDRFDKLCCT